MSHSPPDPYAHPAPAGHGPGEDLGTDLKESLTWAWQAFSRNVAAFLVPGIVYAVLIVGIVTVGVVAGMAASIAVIGSMMDSGEAGSEMTALLALLASCLIVLVTMPFALLPSLLWQSGAIRAASVVATGGRPTIGQGFIGSGPVVLTALAYSAMVGIGMVLFYLPGLVAAFFGFFAVAAAASGARPIDAIKESFALVRANLATVLVVYLVAGLIGSLLTSIVVGVVLVVPFAALMQFGLYERLQRRVPPEPARA